VPRVSHCVARFAELTGPHKSAREAAPAEHCKLRVRGLFRNLERLLVRVARLKQHVLVRLELAEIDEANRLAIAIPFHLQIDQCRFAQTYRLLGLASIAQTSAEVGLAERSQGPALSRNLLVQRQYRLVLADCAIRLSKVSNVKGLIVA